MHNSSAGYEEGKHDVLVVMDAIHLIATEGCPLLYNALLTCPAERPAGRPAKTLTCNADQVPYAARWTVVGKGVSGGFSRR